MPFLSRFVMVIIVGEFGAYWVHRWSHEIPFLWRFHCIHHSAKEMDWLVNTRAHPLDIVLTRFCGLLLVYVLGFAQVTSKTGDAVSMIYVLVVLFGAFLFMLMSAGGLVF